MNNAFLKCMHHITIQLEITKKLKFLKLKEYANSQTQ